MTRSQLAGFVLAALATISLPRSADAQLGGLIKKTVKEAIKPAAKPPAPAESEAAQPARGEKADSLSYVPEITEDRFAALLRGLEAEQQMRAEFRKELARYPTREAYGLCTSNASSSPEMMNILAANAAPENASPAVVQRAMEKMAAELAAHIQKTCPLDPGVWTDASKRMQLERFRLKAAQIAFPLPPTSSSPNGGHPDVGNLLYEVAPSDDAGAALSDTIVSVYNPTERENLTLSQYNTMIERIAAYCDHAFQNPDDRGSFTEGLKFPGTGKDVYWVYTGREIRLLASIDCDKFLKKWDELF